MERYGRPKLKDAERRTASALLVRLNEHEQRVIEDKAKQAGLSPTEWARFAALERDPPARVFIPELNSKAWLELSKLAATLNRAICRLRPGGEGSLKEIAERVGQELAEVRNLLIGNTK